MTTSRWWRGPRVQLFGALAFTVATMAVLAGCGAGERGDRSGPRPESGAPAVNDRTITTEYTVSLDGDVSFTYEEQTPVRVLTVLGGDDRFAALNVLSVGTPAPFARKGGGLARVAFDLTSFRGDGTYAIRAGAPRDLLGTAAKVEAGATSAAPDQSNVLVHLWPGNDAAAPPEVFDRAVEPCTVEVDAGGARGVMRCPKVTNDSGRAFELVMRWGQK